MEYQYKMTQYDEIMMMSSNMMNSLNVKLSNLQLNRLKSGIRMVLKQL